MEATVVDLAVQLVLLRREEEVLLLQLQPQVLLVELLYFVGNW
jgi:hypothetical protein